MSMVMPSWMLAKPAAGAWVLPLIAKEQPSIPDIRDTTLDTSPALSGMTIHAGERSASWRDQ